jgi:hypothetical protein
MNLDALLQELSVLLEIDPFSKDENGIYFLTVDDDVELQFFESPGTNQIIILCDTVEMPETDTDARFLRCLLKANYRWHFSAGGSFGLNPANNQVEFCLRESLSEMTAQHLNSIFESVIASILTVRRELRAAPDTRPGAPPEDLIERMLNASGNSEQYLQA